MNAWRAPGVWETLASEIRDYRRRGFGHLITEDVVRFTTIKSLSAHGADPVGMSTEWPHPRLKGSRIDLVLGKPPVALIELKYPREPNELNAAWTMALGEVLKDLYRLASFPGAVDRLFVYVETARLRRYMAGAAQRYGLDLDMRHVVLHPDDARCLPTTAARTIGADLAAHHVTAERTALLDIDDDLRLAVYQVEPLEGTPEPAARQAAAADDHLASPPAQSSRPPNPVTYPGSPPLSRTSEPGGIRGTREGARREILAAINAVLARSRSGTFRPAEILAEMKRRGTGYADTTIRTMITGHMCSNAPDNAATTYDDVERIDHGVYRLTPR